MAVEYDKKYIKPCFSRETDEYGREIYRPMGMQLVFFADNSNGSLVQGPWVEPVPTLLRGDYTTPTEGTPQDERIILGFEIFDNDAQDGGRLGHWKHPSL